MANLWIQHIKKWASENGTSYGCALSNPACRAAYKPTVSYSKDLQKIGRFLRQGKLQEAREAFNRLRPLVQAMPDSSQKDTHLTLMGVLRRAIQKKMSE
jgi:hypothetical protein